MGRGPGHSPSPCSPLAGVQGTAPGVGRSGGPQGPEQVPGDGPRRMGQVAEAATGRASQAKRSGPPTTGIFRIPSPKGPGPSLCPQRALSPRGVRPPGWMAPIHGVLPGLPATTREPLSGEEGAGRDSMRAWTPCLPLLPPLLPGTAPSESPCPVFSGGSPVRAQSSAHRPGSSSWGSHGRLQAASTRYPLPGLSFCLYKRRRVDQNSPGPAGVPQLRKREPPWHIMEDIPRPEKPSGRASRPSWRRPAGPSPR